MNFYAICTFNEAGRATAFFDGSGYANTDPKYLYLFAEGNIASGRGELANRMKYYPQEDTRLVKINSDLPFEIGEPVVTLSELVQAEVIPPSTLDTKASKPAA